jgi:hypothetical protein
VRYEVKLKENVAQSTDVVTLDADDVELWFPMDREGNDIGEPVAYNFITYTIDKNRPVTVAVIPFSSVYWVVKK